MTNVLTKVRPVRSKPATLNAPPELGADSADEAVLESQAREGSPVLRSKLDDDSNPDSDFAASDDEAASGGERSKARVKSGQPVKESKASTGEVVKKAARKISATAHANFRKLKIKNKNSKANGRNGRFGRRR